MLWIDYAIESAPNGSWRPIGDYDNKTEPMDRGLYNAGDIFMVDSNGWLVKVDDLSVLIELYERRKNEL